MERFPYERLSKLFGAGRYHVMAKFNRALDEVRAVEAKQLREDGYEPVLKHSRWCLLKRKENLTDKQTVKLTELLKYNLKSVDLAIALATFRPLECRKLKAVCAHERVQGLVLGRSHYMCLPRQKWLRNKRTYSGNWLWTPRPQMLSG